MDTFLVPCASMSIYCNHDMLFVAPRIVFIAWRLSANICDIHFLLRLASLHLHPHSIEKMISKKRYHDGSTAATPALSSSNDPRTSSVAPSPAIFLSQRSKNGQQHPRKRVSNHPSSSRPDPVTSPTGPYAAHKHTRRPYMAPSASDVQPENDAEVNEREENDNLDEVIMAVEMRERGTVGCAYYLPREQTLYMVGT